jgi:CheY-like chemotaxis protein
VAEAANGCDALAVALERRVDLMLVDINMPRMDGYTFVESVREAGGAIPLILTSGTIVEKTAVGSIRQGGADYVKRTTSAASASP